MKYELNIPKYSNNSGVELVVENGCSIGCEIRGDSVGIKANREGLITLAKLLIHMSHEDVESGAHIHLADWNCLNKGANEVIIEQL